MMRTTTIAVLLVLFSATLCLAQSNNSVEEEIAELRQQIELLQAENAQMKEMIEELRQALAPFEQEIRAEQRRAELHKLYTARAEQDRVKYTEKQLGEISKLYQLANREWKSDKAIANLRKVIAEYPESNRAGCAALYLGQMLNGDEKIKFLNLAIDKYSDSMYGDGVQVGAFARYVLADYYKSNGEKAKAQALFDYLRKNYPNAIDHSGRLLEDSY